MTSLPLEQFTSRITFIDPAGAKKGQTLKRQACEQAIITIAGDHLDRVFVLADDSGKTSTEQFIQRIFGVSEKWKSTLYCESNGMQELFGPSVMLLAKARGIKLSILPHDQPTGIEKDYRIRTILQPVIAWGRLIIGPGMETLTRQILSFPSGRLKDRVDALASAITHLPTRTAEKQKIDAVEDLAAYLRKIGAPSHVIERRVREAMSARRMSEDRRPPGVAVLG